VILLQTLATTDVLMFSQLRDVQSNLQGVPMKHQLQRSTRALAVTAFVLGASLTALAQTPPAGRLLASNCFQCHGTNGKGPGFDSLNGKSASEINKDLIEFRSGKEGRRADGQTLTGLYGCPASPVVPMAVNPTLIRRTTMHRRNFLIATAASTMTASVLADDKRSSSSATSVVVPKSSQVKARVIVIGGGMAGTTVAKVPAALG
jgi:sulfide dehydrogenase cytochrome subunit